MNIPAVSILLAAYNTEKYVRESLDSLLNQTFRDFELVAIDDASQDATWSILQEYAAKDSRIVLHRNERNLKLAASLNRGLQLCKAPLIARADADDVYTPVRLEKQIAYMAKHPETDVLSSSYHRMNERGELLDIHMPPIEHEPIRFTLLWQSPICHAAAMYRREAVLGVGGYDSAYTAGQDYDLWARMREKAGFHNLPEPLMFVRYHGQSTLAKRGPESARLWAGISNRLMSRYLGREMPIEESQPLVNLLCAYTPISEKDSVPGFRLLEELLGRARQCETPAAAAWVEKAASQAILKHAEMFSYESPARSWRLLWRAAPSAWRTGGTAAICKQLGRLCVLGPFRRLKKRTARFHGA